MNKKIVFIVSLLMTFVLIGNVLAITAKGWAPKVIRVETWEELEKYVLVINDNDFPLNIEVFVEGDLKDSITIKDNNFTLQPGEEKKAYFTINMKEPGSTIIRINVKYIPKEGNGAGLSHEITIIASSDLNDDTNNENNKTVNNSSMKSVSESITGNISVGANKKYVIAFSTTLILAIIFIVVLILYYNKFKVKNNKDMVEIKKAVKTKLKKRVKKRG